MLRVPGSRDDLLKVKARAADVRIVYSPLDALRLAKEHPDRQVVFFAVGFETTAPANAMAVHRAWPRASPTSPSSWPTSSSARPRGPAVADGALIQALLARATCARSSDSRTTSRSPRGTGSRSWSRASSPSTS